MSYLIVRIYDKDLELCNKTLHIGSEFLPESTHYQAETDLCRAKFNFWLKDWRLEIFLRIRFAASDWFSIPYMGRNPTGAYQVPLENLHPELSPISRTASPISIFSEYTEP